MSSINQNSYNLLQKINFGDIDGMYDPNLDDYFLDRDYTNKILNKTKYFVIGRKGTGKSALYTWINNRSLEKGHLCSNVKLGDFPVEKLYGLKDPSFALPYQYQTICKNMILNEMAKLIVNDEYHIANEQYNSLRDYISKSIGTDLDDCFRQTIQKAKQINGSLSINGLGLCAESGDSETYNYHCNEEMSHVNTILQDTIIKYLISYNNCEKSHFLVQIDGLDENYNQITTNSDRSYDYLQFLISLMKANYSINQIIHQKCNDIARCIIYIRSDIFNIIHGYDAESARWEQYSETLSWVVEGHRWQHNDLRSLINRRIYASLGAMTNDGFSQVFHYKAIDIEYRKRHGNRDNGNIYEKNIFKYIVNRSFHRPRDIIQFCIKIQEESCKEGTLNFKAFNLAEREYSLWFLSEITNEIAPKISNYKVLFAFLRTLGSKPTTITTFRNLYENYEEIIGMNSTELLNYLYDTGIISNINDKGEWFSIVRNEKSRLNPDIKIILHPGFWKGLYTSTF